MSIFCSLDEKSLLDLKNSREKFETGLKKLNSEEKDYLLMYMYKARHNLLMNLAEEKNKNFCLLVFSGICILLKLIALF